MRRCSFDEVIDAVCLQYGCDRHELLGDRRLGSIVEPRHVAMYLCRKYGKLSYAGLGLRFKRDHSTVINGVLKIRNERGIDPDLDTHLCAIEGMLDLQREIAQQPTVTNPRIALLIPQAMIREFAEWSERKPGAYFDQRGRLCMADSDFMRASEDGALPIAVFLPENR